MRFHRFHTRNLALICSFASLYAVLWVGPLFPVIGAQGKFFTLATVTAPLIGLILGPYVGAATASVGGLIGWSITQTGALFFLSFVPSAASALCSGLLYKRRWVPCAILYGVLLLTLALYPTVGPGWLFPAFLWFEFIGFILLISPLRSKAVNYVNSHTNFLELSLGVGVTSFISTLFGHIVGVILYQLIYFPTVYPQIGFWQGLWQTLTFLYPVERVLMTLIATTIGAPLIEALRAYKFEIGG